MGSSNYPPIPPPGGGTPSLPTEGQPNPLQPGEYGPTSIASVATFSFKGIPPPSGLYITRNDVLEIYCINSAPGITLDVHARLLLASPVSVVPGQPDSPPDPKQSSIPSNTVVTMTQNFTINTVKTNQYFIMPLSEGWLLNLSVGCSPGFSKKGQTYVVVIMQRGDLVNSPQSGALLSGYVASSTNLIWPQTGSMYPVDGDGWLHSVNQANPGAGADFLITVPTVTRWRIRSLNAQLITANAGVARIVRLQIKDASGNLVWQAAAQGSVAINTTVQVSAAPGQSVSGSDTTTITIPMAGDVKLPQGFTIGTSTLNINGTDQYSNIWAEVEEWLEN